MVYLLGMFVAGVVGWLVLQRQRRARRSPAAFERARDALRQLASDVDWRFVDHEMAPSIVEGNGERRLVLGTAGFADYDGDAAIVDTRAPWGFALAVWPREAPDAIAARGWQEIATGDEVFDARFSVFSNATRLQIDCILDAERRANLLELGTPALVVEAGGATLLLPGIPDG